jgi:hypothetical protein
MLVAKSGGIHIRDDDSLLRSWSPCQSWHPGVPEDMDLFGLRRIAVQYANRRTAVTARSSRAICGCLIVTGCQSWHRQCCAEELPAARTAPVADLFSSEAYYRSSVGVCGICLADSARRSTNRGSSGSYCCIFPGSIGTERPGVLMFPKVLVCLDCGASRFDTPVEELRQLRAAA